MKKYLPAALIATVAILLSSACAGTAETSVHSQTHDPAGINAPAAIDDSPAAPTGPPAHPKFESTGLSAGWVDPKTGLNISNDMWNCPQAACGKQEVWANSSGDWGVVSTMAKGNTAVLTYPAVQEQFGANNQPASLANASELVSTFTEAMPTTAGTIGEAAYDIWLNGWNTEVMIWVDNQHQTFYQPLLGTATFNGQQFRIYMDHGVSHGYPSGPFFFVLQHNETHGTIDILAVFHWLERAGYLSATKGGLNAVDFGWEICSTNGVPENFNISHYTLTVKGIQLSAGKQPAGPRARAEMTEPVWPALLPKMGHRSVVGVIR